MSKIKSNDLIPDQHPLIGAEKQLETINFGIEHNMPLLLIGETGVGKTSYIRHLAHHYKAPLRRVNLNGQTSVDEFVGKTLLNEKGTFWQDGVLTQAMREGQWLVLDELNAALPEILFVLHSLLDDDRYIVLSEKDGEVIRPHKNFRLFATMNPSGKYSGTKDLNKALISRFPIIMQVGFPGTEQEVAILQQYSKVSTGEALALVKMAQQLRASYEKDEIEYVCSTRDIINCAKLASLLDMQQALQFSVLNRVSQEDMKAVTTVVSLYFGMKGESKFGDKYDSIDAQITKLEQATKQAEKVRDDVAITIVNVANMTSAICSTINQEISQQSYLGSNIANRLQRYEMEFMPMMRRINQRVREALTQVDIKNPDFTYDMGVALNVSRPPGNIPVYKFLKPKDVFLI